MTTPESPPIPTSDVCGLLHIDRSTLSRWVASGRITPLFKAPGTRGSFFFDPAEVQRVKQELAA